MPKKGGKKKVKASEVNLDVEIISRMEIKCKDTMAITGVAPESKLVDIYQMIRNQNVPDAGLKEMFLYQNIRNLGITKFATLLELFPFSEVIGWILPQENSSSIIYNIEGEAFASFTSAYMELAYKLPLA